jgi:hypothetical protein
VLNLVHVKTNKLLQVCKQIIAFHASLFTRCRQKLRSHCLFPVVVTSLEQVINSVGCSCCVPVLYGRLELPNPSELHIYLE